MVVKHDPNKEKPVAILAQVWGAFANWSADSTMVLISKQNRKKLYTHLFNEGAMVVKHDPNKEKHDEVDIPNLHAMMLLRSLASRNYLTEVYNWRWHYYFLTNE